MIFASLAAGALTETLQGVRNRFQEGGSFTMLLLVLLGIGAVVLVAYWLTLQQHRAERRARLGDPRGLFRTLQDKLGLTSIQRQLIDTIATDLRIENPAVILICPALFDHHLSVWSANRRKSIASVDKPSLPGVVAELRTRLFPGS